MGIYSTLGLSRAISKAGSLHARSLYEGRVCESVSDPLFAVRLKAASFLDLQAVIRSRCRNTVPYWKPYLKARGILTRYDNLRDRSELVPTCSLGESRQRFVIAQGDKGTMTLARKIPSSFVLSLSIRYLLDILLYRDSYLRILFPSLVKSKTGLTTNVWLSPPSLQIYIVAKLIVPRIRAFVRS